MDIEALVEEFTTKLTALLEANAMEQARAAVTAAFGTDGRKLRAGGSALEVSSAVRANRRRPRRKGPIQLCPVPGCQNRAAPVFGMVCAKHKDLPKAKIRKYREARRLAKAKAAA
jgi:hypothetical protein